MMNGIKNGIDIEYTGDRSVNRRCVNLPISNVDEPKVNDQIEEDVRAGIKAGPFDHPPFPTFSCSPIGAVPKKRSTKIRVIHHLSHPRGGDSINAHTRDEYQPLGSFDAATDYVRQLGAGCYLVKIDVKSAYKLVRVRKEDQPLLGFKWRNRYYYERCLPFGLKSSCRLWELYATALDHIFGRSGGIEWRVHYIDDFLFVAQTREAAQTNLDRALSLCTKLGVPIAHDKTEGPSTCLTFLGIELDTVKMEARLSQDKLTDLRSLLHEWVTKRTASITELSSLEGQLQWCTNVVRPGRSFIDRIRSFKSARKQSGEGPHVLIAEVRRDIAWWSEFVSEWNGVSLFYELEWTQAEKLHLETDACEAGWGCRYGNRWIKGAWTQDVIESAWQTNKHGDNTRSMPFLEMLAVVYAASVWGHQWAGKRIVFHVDCVPVVESINSRRSKSTRMHGPIRSLSLSACRYGFDFKCRWIKGTSNVAADALSRDDMNAFRQHVPTSSPHPDDTSRLPPLHSM